MHQHPCTAYYEVHKATADSWLQPKCSTLIGTSRPCKAWIISEIGSGSFNSGHSKHGPVGSRGQNLIDLVFIFGFYMFLFNWLGQLGFLQTRIEVRMNRIIEIRGTFIQCKHAPVLKRAEEQRRNRWVQYKPNRGKKHNWACTEIDLPIRHFRGIFYSSNKPISIRSESRCLQKGSWGLSRIKQ